jgi:hypothetical protein
MFLLIRIENRPDDWERLEEKYDDGGKYRMAYMESKAAGNDETASQK